MTLTAVQQARARSALHSLACAGKGLDDISNRANRAAAWSSRLEAHILTELQRHRTALVELGIDVNLIPPPPRSTPQAATPDWSIPAAMAVRTQADVLSDTAAGGDRLNFDTTLDGLRAVPVSDLDGVGDKTVQRLGAAGIASVYDLLMWVPLRYVDRSELTALAELAPGMVSVTFVARVKRVDVSTGSTPYVRLLLGDADTTVGVYYFRQMWMADRFDRGDVVIAQGDGIDFNGRLQLSHPIVERLEESSAPLMAMYRQSAKYDVNTWLLRRAAVDALRRIPELVDPVPGEFISRRGLPGRLEALRSVHVPDTAGDACAGRDRLAYDELLRLQLALGVLRFGQAQTAGVTHRPTGELTGRWQRGLPYTLTGAQKRALNEIFADMVQDRPMARLVQGDVGAGKTAVLAGAALMAIEGGYQAALLAPTEILARQHCEELAEALRPLGVVVELLVSRNLPRPRREVLAGLASGQVQLVVGTHALLSPAVQFHALGLALVDEQHRFGVDQRALLAEKGPDGACPDIVQATATPIPRTAAISVYGDLAVSVLDEKPPGRSPITTHWVDREVSTTDAQARPWQSIRAEVAAGHQAFVVCPRVVVSGKESETRQAAAAVETAAELASGALAGLRIGVATGKQAPDERAAQMAAFKAGEVDVLVATTVIEVGVSVPNATVIVVLDAASFGLAQLHQLRGRVGRSALPSACWLVAADPRGDGQARLEAMVDTNDGFELAERDLVIRGPGSLLGTAQAGREAGLLVADLVADADIHMAARADAAEILSADPTLGRHRVLKTEVELALGDDAHYLTKA